MKRNDWQQLGITADTDNLRELSLAVAARGILAGASAEGELLHQPWRWQDSLSEAMVRGRIVPLHMLDRALLEGPSLLPSAVELACAWKECLAALNARGTRVRIAVQPPVGRSRWVADSALVTAAMVNPHPGAGNGVVTSVITQADLAVRSVNRWPLHIGILPGESAHILARRLSTITMVRRGLANVSVLTSGEANCDVLVAPCSLRDLRSKAFARGIRPTAGAVIVPGEGSEQRGQLGALLRRLQETFGVGIVVTGLPRGDAEALWMNQLIRSLSHRETLDTAVWEAYRSTRRPMSRRSAAHPMPMPMIFANPASLLDSPIVSQVSNLQERLLKLEYMAIQGGRNVETGAALPDPLPLKAVTDGLLDLSYVREAGGATDVAAMSRTVAAMEAAAHGSDPRPPLYGDITFFDQETTLRVDDRTESLVKMRGYELEVALRQRPNGVSHRRPHPKPVASLPASREIELMVVVNGNDDFKVAQPTQTLRLPAEADADSDPVRFLVRPLRTTFEKREPCSLEIRIYYDLNLLEFLLVRATVVDEFDEPPDDALNALPIVVAQSQRVERGYRDMDRWQAPRHLGIDIRREGDLAWFTFTARAETAKKGEKLELLGQLDIALSHLIRELNRMRELWEEIAVNMIGASLQPPDHVFQTSVLRLAEAGRDLWSLLFRGTAGSSMSVIGNWLWSHRLQDGAVIDVQLMEGAAAFAFPWSLLYDKDLPVGALSADPEGFWGVRYAIGQSAMDWHHSDAPIGSDPASKLEFMLWKSFPNVTDQTELLQKLAADSNNRLTVQAPITTKQAFAAMVQECDADILYFYTHGYTRPASVDSGYDPLQRIRQRFELLSEKERAASGLQPLYDLITEKDFKPDESWIKLSSGHLMLRELRALRMNLRRAPVVFLNMCQSAQVMPGLADSFVTLFLERRARSVLGTECPMTTVFAHAFSEKLLEEFFAGKSLGESLRLTRLHFMKSGNPLGLAYSLFGTATTRYEPALL